MTDQDSKQPAPWHYSVTFSEPDNAWIATAEETPGIANIENDPVSAFVGFVRNMEPSIREFLAVGGNLSTPVKVSAPGL